MINVYSENTTNFNNNGLATLIPLTAEFSSDINGAWTLSITHPYDAEERYKHLVKNAILQADVGCIREQSTKQLFRIYDVKRNLQSLSVIAFPIGMEATFDAPIEELKIPDEAGVSTASGVDAAGVLDAYVKNHDDNNKYTVSSNVTTQNCSQWENTNLIAALSGSDDNSFINKWGGEVLYNNYAITVKNRIGNATPKFPVEYGKNLTGMEHDLDMSTVITRVYPLSTDGLRLHQYDDLDIDYWYGTFDGDQKKNYAKSQYLYNYNDHTWYQFDSNGKLLTDPIPAEMLAILDQFDWHENETGWWYGLDSTYFISNGWVEDSDGKHYWMDSQGYMDSQWTDTEVWTWNQFDDSGEHYGEKRNSFVDSSHIRDYPYIRSAFLSSPYELIDTDSKSNSLTAQATATWKAALYDAIEAKAEELWNTVLTDTTNAYCAEYIQELIGDIATYTQARYVYSHKGWQSLIKSLIKSGIEWIKDEELSEEGWIEVNGYMYGDFDNDGNFRNYPKSQYLYCYSESKWYYFEADGIMSTDEIPAEKLAELNDYDWRTDETGQYYGDGQGHYIANGWVENSDGTHSWVNADGYYEAQWDDSDTWDWTQINGWRYGRSSTQYVRSCYVEIDKNLEYFGADGFWRDWMRVPAEDMGWYQVKEGANAGKWWYGSLNRYYAHNEYVYMTVSGTLEEWWYDEEGWYDEDKSGETDYEWHEDSTGHWFGTEDEDTGEKDKYIHDKWTFIDGTYYWFDSDGYISGDANKAKLDWQWGDLVDEVSGNHWFGNENEDFNRMWLAGQWMKIDGEWYHFNSDGYMDDESTKRSQTITWFSNAIVAALNPVASEKLKEAYELLYDQMVAWVQRQYANGLDLPNITVTVDLVDLSKTSEYAEYADLEKIYLGDGVTCNDSVHDMHIDARVVGLTYDLIRGYNTKVTIGQLAKNLSQILSVNYQGSGKDTSVTNAIAGDGVKIDGQVISVEGATGASYGIQDVTYKGVSKVSGNVAILDELGIEHIDLDHEAYEELPDSKNSDDKFYFITDEGIILHNGIAYGDSRNITYGLNNPTGGEDGDLYFKVDSEGNITGIYQNHEGVWGSFAGAGLQYWVETNQNFKREIVESVSGASWTCDEAYQVGWFSFKQHGDVWVTKQNSNIVCGALMSIWSGGEYRYKPILISLVSADTVYNIRYYNTPLTTEFVINGVPLYYCIHSIIYGCGSGETEPTLDYAEGSDTLPWLGKFDNENDAVEALLAVSHFRTNEAVSTGIGIGDFLFWGGETGIIGEEPPSSLAYKARLTKSGIWEATDYQIGGVSIDKVRDVQVDDGSGYSSVVTDKIAKLDLKTKQDKLVPGTNITIGADGKTISATDTDEISELNDVVLSNLTNGQVLKYDSASQKWINANESGGSEVIANPSGTATDTLSKLSIDGTVYDIEGSSGEGYTEDVLWNTGGTTSSWANPLIITLNENISDYDAIRISFTDVDGNDGFVFIPTSEIPSNYADKYFVGAGDFLATVNVNSDTQISCYAKNGITMTYNNVIGISYGSGGSGGGGGSSEVNYSTEEQRIGTWIDGKPLYQKTFDMRTTTLADNAWNNNILGTVGTGIKIREFDGKFGLNGYGDLYADYSYFRSTSEYFTAALNSTDDDIGVRPNMNAGVSVMAGIVTIRYTKTTD